MSLDVAANFCRGSVAAISDITATSITYSLAGPTAFPTPQAGLTNPDVGYNVVGWMSGTYASPDLDPNAFIFRVTSLTSTVLTGYYTEGTVQPTLAGTYTVILGPTQKFRDDSFSEDYEAPYELLVQDAFDFEPTPTTANALPNGIYLSTSTGWSSVSGMSQWQYLSAATLDTYSWIGRAVGTAFDTGQVLNASLSLAHRLKASVLPLSAGSGGANLFMILGFAGAGGAPTPQYQAAGTGNGIFFRIDMSVSTTQLQCVVKNGTTESVVNLTSTSYPFTAFHTFEIIAFQSYAAFFIDGSFVALIATASSAPVTNWGTPLNTVLSAVMPTANIGWILSMETLAAAANGSTIDWYKFRRAR